MQYGHDDPGSGPSDQAAFGRAESLSSGTEVLSPLPVLCVYVDDLVLSEIASVHRLVSSLLKFLTLASILTYSPEFLTLHISIATSMLR